MQRAAGIMHTHDACATPKDSGLPAHQADRIQAHHGLPKTQAGQHAPQKQKQKAQGSTIQRRGAGGGGGLARSNAHTKCGKAVNGGNGQRTRNARTFGNNLPKDEVAGGAHLAPMQTGEICVQGPQVMLGYLDRPEETASILRDGWLHTGDLGHLDAEGHLFITERRKELIKVKGFQVARLAAHPTRAAAAAHRRRRTATRPPWP